MDGASNRGIDEIRALREEIHSLPFESKYKVYIIDEVHMLTKEAFNALLKTLEEPPKHVVFILATTEFEKLPDTIVSRCQSFTFKTPGTPVLKEMLLRASKKEKITLEPAAAELIALLASGSFRDAYGILQKAMTATGTSTLSLDDVASVTGAPRSSLLLEILEHTAQGNLDGALTTVHTLSEHGNDMRFVLTLILRMVRAVLLLREAPSIKQSLETEFSEDEWVMLQNHAQNSKERVNSRLLMHLLDADLRTGSTYIPELPLELALIEHLKK
jgi:DNA polymerase-3 subunit gamma/tau